MPELIKSVSFTLNIRSFDTASNLSECTLAARNLAPLPSARINRAIPYLLSSVAAGFPSPADDYTELDLDFQRLLVRRPAATFAVRVTGESMIGAGIFPEDILVVDKSLSVQAGDVIVAYLEGEFLVKHYQPQPNCILLVSNNPLFPAIEVTPDQDFQVWGVVSSVVRVVRS